MDDLKSVPTYHKITDVLKTLSENTGASAEEETAKNSGEEQAENAEIKRSENAAQITGTSRQNWSKWKTWNATLDENSAVTGMQFLKELCAAYQADLTRLKERYEDDKSKQKKKSFDIIHTIKENGDMAVKKLESANAAVIAEIDKEEKDYESRTGDLQYLLVCNNEVGGNFIEKKLNSLFAAQDAAVEKAMQALLQQSEAEGEKLLNTIEAARSQQILLHKAKVKQARAKTQIEEEKERARYKKEVDAIESSFKAAEAAMRADYAAALEDVMSDKDITAYINTAHSTERPFDNYSCSEIMPEYICLGDVTMELARKINTLPEVTSLLMDEAEKAIDTKATGMITAKLPYCQRLDEGISLFLNYSPTERKTYQSYLQMMLLKLFMAFPAGKLEATMIDPLELGESFSMFTKLGEKQPRIIDTKIWSQEKDISEAVSILRQKLETMTQAYGNDSQTRLKKEPVRVLAITDFPTGFNQNALRDLQAIVRKSAAYGICVFIWANSEEIEKLQASQQSVFNEIKQMLHVASAEDGDVLALESAKYEGVSLHLDSLAPANSYIPEIISALVKGIGESQAKPEPFEDLFEEDINDLNNWHGETTAKELSIPIGIKGANTVVKMVMGKTDGNTAHHALIAGQTGAGKSTLLHTIIMSTLLSYSPDEVQLYLVDFKEGVEFKTYSKLSLPAVKVVAIDCEREFGLNILKELQKEMKRRYDLFKREADREDIASYREVTGKKMPKILAVFDEVQELFRDTSNDKIGKDCENLLSELLTLGRAAGIHIVLASQNFNLISSIKQVLFAHAAIRIAIRGSEDSASSVLGEGNHGAKQLQDGAVGAAVYNDASGKESANVIFQVAYLGKEKRADYLKKLSALQNNEAFAKKYKEKTRVLLTNAEDDIFNAFNRFIIDEQYAPINEDANSYTLIVGSGFELHRKFEISIAPQAGQNLLIIGSDEKTAAAIFYFSILSLLYDELANKDVRSDNQLICLIDLSVEDEYHEPDNTNFEQLAAVFKNQIERVKMSKMESLIDTVYEAMMSRLEGSADKKERLFLMFFGVNRAHKLAGGNMYEDGDVNEMSTISKLNEIIKRGAKVGINCIFWGENLAGTNRILSANAERYFSQRIAFSTDKETMEQFVMEQDANSLRPTTAVYMNVDEDLKNTHFRPYEIPAKVWVDKIAKTYHKFENGEV